MLLLIKAVHTLIWLVFVSIILYVIYCAVANQISVFTWIAILSLIMEGLVLLIFKNQCPLTIMARKYSGSTKDNFDIFLPEWLARHNKTIFTSLFLAGVIFVLLRYTQVLP
jgi:hypothetical protein